MGIKSFPEGYRSTLTSMKLSMIAMTICAEQETCGRSAALPLPGRQTGPQSIAHMYSPTATSDSAICRSDSCTDNTALLSRLSHIKAGSMHLSKETLNGGCCAHHGRCLSQ